MSDRIVSTIEVDGIQWVPLGDYTMVLNHRDEARADAYGCPDCGKHKPEDCRVPRYKNAEAEAKLMYDEAVRYKRERDEARLSNDRKDLQINRLVRERDRHKNALLGIASNAVDYPHETAGRALEADND